MSGIGDSSNLARFTINNGGSASLSAFKLKYPFTGAVSDSILTYGIALIVRFVNFL